MTPDHHEPEPSSKATNVKNAISPLYFVVAALLWTLTIAALGYWHYDRVAAGFQATAASAARQSIEKDKIYRLWAAEQGGVYVSETPLTPSNPYLAHIPERDITSPSGRPLTLVNPAYMTRQVHEMASERFGSRGKITSLNPLRPENQPDDWETQALQRFNAGEQEYSSLAMMDGELFLRMMSPFHAEAPCLHCHGFQGYEVGDLIGGIAVAIPWRPYQQAHQQAWVGYGFGYGGVWILGLVLLEGHRQRLRLYLEQQRQNEQRHRSILQTAMDGIWLTDKKGRFIEVNETYCRMSGYSMQELLTMSITDVEQLEAADDTAARIEKIMALGADRFESQHRRKDGTVFDVEVSIQYRPADGGQFVAFLQDITERKQAVGQLKQQKTQLEQRNRALKQFNYAVSHELKTPLVSIESSLGLIQSTLLPTADPELTRIFGYARHATRQMNNLLESLLLMFRIDTAGSDTQTTDFRGLVQNSIDQLTRENKLKDIRWTIATEGRELRGDRHKLVQIWLQLIDNAAKYMGDQKHPAINVGVEQTEQKVQFYVRDNGMGIEQINQGKIFGLFDQLDKTAAGTGLGLTLVQRIVDYYGGTIRVESAGTGQGSCFYFTLPDALINKDRTI